jgi:3'-phosphoadenosine 5'-phosphosulfate sulfotransferase (PAPS reductase)/FAD synthetase
MTSLSRYEDKFQEVIDLARADGGKKFYALFSGGKDSVTTAHMLDKAGLLEGCLFVDTTIAIPDTVKFVEDYCEKMNWDLEIITRSDKCKTYDEFVMRYGFPSAGFHNITMLELKWKPLREWVMKRKDEGVVLCSGVRSKESKRRMVNTKKYQRDKSCKHMRWAAPIHYMSTSEVWAYIHEHGLKRSPVYDNIGMSGDCMCGAFSSHGEAELLEIFYPEVADKIRDMEDRCTNKRDTWGNGSSMQGVKQQTNFNDWACADCKNDCETTVAWADRLAEAKK